MVWVRFVITVNNFTLRSPQGLKISVFGRVGGSVEVIGGTSLAYTTETDWLTRRPAPYKDVRTTLSSSTLTDSRKSVCISQLLGGGV